MVMPGSNNDILVSKLRSLSKVRVQNSLMRMADRPIALAMREMDDPDRDFVLAHLPAAKVERIEDEIRLQKRLRITTDQYAKGVHAMLEALDRESGGGSLKSYIRPKKR
jgi:hypothetical protein